MVSLLPSIIILSRTLQLAVVHVLPNSQPYKSMNPMERVNLLKPSTNLAGAGWKGSFRKSLKIASSLIPSQRGMSIINNK
jgi:hypothetical protein